MTQIRMQQIEQLKIAASNSRKMADIQDKAGYTGLAASSREMAVARLHAADAMQDSESWDIASALTYGENRAAQGL
jgi:hypothetical protein